MQDSAHSRRVLLLLPPGFRKAHQSDMQEMTIKDIYAYIELCMRQRESTGQQRCSSIRVQKAALKTTESRTVPSTQKYQGCPLMALAGSQFQPRAGLIRTGWRTGKRRGKQKLALNLCSNLIPQTRRLCRSPGSCQIFPFLPPSSTHTQHHPSTTLESLRCVLPWGGQSQAQHTALLSLASIRVASTCFLLCSPS